MATVNQNLSDFDLGEVSNAKDLRLGVVVSEWNRIITQSLLNGALEVFRSKGILERNIIVKWVPGSFELPLAAQFILEHNKLDGILTLGSVIEGETKHFDFVCNSCAIGVKDVGLKYNKPVIFGVLTDQNMQQAIDRSGGKYGNKGIETAVALLKMVRLQNSLR